MVFRFTFIKFFSALICRCIGTTLDVALILFAWMSLLVLELVDMSLSALTFEILAIEQSFRPLPQWP